MSSLLQIAFDNDMPPASVEVMAPDMQVVKRIMLFAGRSKVVEVPSENSYLRVHMPSGRIAVLEDPGNLNRVISLKTIQARPESSGISPGLSDQKPASPPKRSGSAGSDFGSFGDLIDEETMDELFGEEEAEAEEEPQDLPAPSSSKPPVNINLDIDFGSSFELNKYQTSRYRMEQETPADRSSISLKGVADVQLLYSDDDPVLGQSAGNDREAHWHVNLFPDNAPLNLQLKEESGIEMRLRVPAIVEHLWARVDQLSWTDQQSFSIRLTTSSAAADTIMNYLQRGDLHAAEAMLEWADRAERMLAGKRQDPYGATVGAYLLLQFRDFDRLHNWSRNLANWIDYLPDGCVIWATQLMHQRPDKENEIREYLLKAVDRGMPVYTEGLRLLLDGLRALGPAGRDAFLEVTRQAGVVMWDAPLTTTVHATGDASGATSSLYDIAFGSAG